MVLTNKHSTNGVASNSTTVGMNSQNVSRPASAIKKLNGQSPSQNYMGGAKFTNLPNNEYKNLLTYNSKVNDGKEKIQSSSKSSTQKGLENFKLHKKTSSVS